MARPIPLTLYTFEEILKAKDDDLILETFNFWLPPEDLWFVLKDDFKGVAVDIYDFGKKDGFPVSQTVQITTPMITRAFKDHDFSSIYNAQEYKAACKEAAEKYMLKYMFDVIDDLFTLRVMKTIMGTYNMTALYFDSTVMEHQDFANKIHLKIQSLPSYAEFEPDAPEEKQPNDPDYADYIIELNEFMFNTIPNMEPGEIEEVLESEEAIQEAYMMLDEMNDFNLTYFYIYLILHRPDVLPEAASNMREKFGDNEEVALFIRKMRYVLKED